MVRSGGGHYKWGAFLLFEAFHFGAWDLGEPNGTGSGEPNINSLAGGRNSVGFSSSTVFIFGQWRFDVWGFRCRGSTIGISVGERVKITRSEWLFSTFFHWNWDIVSWDIVTIVKAFLSIGIPPTFLNQTDITHIPKVRNLVCASKFHPISLCNFGYKIISKVLVNRLKTCLP